MFHVSLVCSSEGTATPITQQAAMLYVCLYFAPKLLKSKESQMREVVRDTVDKECLTRNLPWMSGISVALFLFASVICSCHNIWQSYPLLLKWLKTRFAKSDANPRWTSISTTTGSSLCTWVMSSTCASIGRRTRPLSPRSKTLSN